MSTYPSMLDPIKTVKCKECGIDVKVNANYPITEVGCRDWYCPKKPNGTNHDGVKGSAIHSTLE